MSSRTPSSRPGLPAEPSAPISFVVSPIVYLPTGTGLRARLASRCGWGCACCCFASGYVRRATP